MRVLSSMWSSVKIRGIVLTSSPLREADRRYTALTKEWGKVEFIGRGARKGKAKLAAHVEPLAEVDLELIKSTRQVTVIGAERAAAYPTLSTDLSARLLALSAGAVLDRTLKVEDIDEGAFDAYQEFLQFLDGTSELTPLRSMFIWSAFLLRHLAHLGYAIELDACVTCRAPIFPLSFRWHAGRGGLVCTSCAMAQANDISSTRQIDEEIVALMRFARSGSYADLLRPALAGERVQNVAQCVTDVWLLHVPDGEIPLKAAVLLE